MELCSNDTDSTYHYKTEGLGKLKTTNIIEMTAQITLAVQNINWSYPLYSTGRENCFQMCLIRQQISLIMYQVEWNEESSH